MADSVDVVGEERRYRRPAEGATSCASFAASAERQPAAQKKSLSFRQLLASPAMWGIILGTYCYMYFVYYCMTWMPLYFKEKHGMSITQMGWYSGVSFAGMAAVAALAGYAADRLIAKGRDPINVRKGFTIAGFVMAATQTISVFTESR